LNPIEEAEAFQNLSKEFRMSHEAIASRVGKSRVAVTTNCGLDACRCQAGSGG
jgi:ParB-like chromosome segregation protein Spo0J